MSENQTLTVSVPSARFAEELQPLPAGVELHVWKMDGPPPRPAFDIVVLPQAGVDVMHRLTEVKARMVQGASIGYEHIIPALPEGNAFANSATVNEAPTAEFAVGLMIAAQRDLPAYAVAQSRSEWKPIITDSVVDRRVLLLGYGGVGKAVAARLAGFGVHLTVVAHTARVEDGITVHGVDELPGLLPHAEIVILTLPGGESTRHLIDDKALATLPDGALIVNVGRGSVVDTDALVDHISRGRIRAALDVMETEPLPEGHPLWSLPGSFIAPHVGGMTKGFRAGLIRLVKQQIERMLRDEPPLNIVIGTVDPR